MKYFVDIPKLKHSKILQEMQCVLLRDLLLKIQMGLMGKCNKWWNITLSATSGFLNAEVGLEWKQLHSGVGGKSMLSTFQIYLLCW